jgi:hypothetical protein
VILTKLISQIIPSNGAVHVGLIGVTPVNTPQSAAELTEKNNKLHVNE